MGGFCSKMEETTDNGSDSNHHLTHPDNDDNDNDNADNDNDGNDAHAAQNDSIVILRNNSPTVPVQEQEQQQQQPLQQYTPPDGYTANENEDEEDAIVSSPDGAPESSNLKSTKKRKNTFGFLRIGGASSRNVSTSKSNSNNNNVTATTTLHHPNSPTMRATSYSMVHEAVSMNFQKAATKHNKTAAYFASHNVKSMSGKNGSLDGTSAYATSKAQLPFGVVGIRNLGNTCFLNSSLQCLSATIPLTDYFLAYQYKQEINHHNPLGTGGKLVVEYAELVKEIWLGKNSIVKPGAFKSQLERFAPQFRGFRQHDSQELLAYLLDGIHEDLNLIEKKPYIEDRDCDGTTDEKDAIEAWKNYLRRDKSLIVDIFQGQMRSRLQCLTCGHANIRFEPFMYLSLPMSASCRTITDCLELYLESETMTGANQWYCSKCKTHRDATKKTDLWILPPILIIHLKRFNFNDYGQLGSKNTAAIDYPTLDWDLSKFVRSRGSERPLYDCYAVSNHIGGLHGGHYTAYSLNRFNDQWYEFNDSSYRAVDTEELQRNSRSAYVLFYNRSQGAVHSDTASLPNTTNGDTEEGDGVVVMQRAAAGRTLPLIRRQSVSRPDLWPHTQVQDSLFREFSRQSTRQLPPLLPFHDSITSPIDECGESPTSATGSSTTVAAAPFSSSNMTITGVVIESNRSDGRNGGDGGAHSPSSPMDSIEVEPYSAHERRLRSGSSSGGDPT